MTPPMMSLATMELLHELYEKYQQDAAKKLSGYQAHAIVMQVVAAKDWYEKLIITPIRCKVFFASIKKNRLH